LFYQGDSSLDVQKYSIRRAYHITLIVGAGQDAPRMHGRESNLESGNCCRSANHFATATHSLRSYEEKACLKHPKEVHVIVILLSEKKHL
jgi:hypothetical protein